MIKENSELDIRPKTLDEFIGQDEIKKKLSIYIEAAKKRGEPLDHTLFYGPPGLGKTTLAKIIANELNSNIKLITAPSIEKQGELAAILTNLKPMDILFIDEIHRLHPSIEELLYPAMEDYSLDIIVGKGTNARNIKLKLPPFTLIGATTRIGLLTNPLLSRFGITLMVDYYSTDSLKLIVLRAGKVLGIEITDEASTEIAKRSRGTPRRAIMLLKRVRDVAQVSKRKKIEKDITLEAFKILNIDEEGLDQLDRKILLTIAEKFNGGPVGLKTLASAINEEKDTIEEVYEPYLLRKGFLKITSRGRQVTEKVYKYFNLKNIQKPLF